MDLIKIINNDYSSILSVAIAIITMLITLVYVFIVHKQMKAAQQSIDVAITQAKQNNQPCIIPVIVDTFGTECFSGSRRQLSVDINLENIGDSPAISAILIGSFELQYTSCRKDGSNVINIDYPPEFINFIKAGAIEKANIIFETREIMYLIEDLKISMEKNIERLKTDPSRNHYHGTSLVIEVYYRNMLGQWFKSTVCREIAWIKVRNKVEKKDPTLNKYTVPPLELKEDDKFSLQLIAPRFSKSNIELVSEKVVRNRVDQFMDEFSQSNIVDIV